MFVLSGVGDADKELEKNFRSELVKLRLRGVFGEFVSDEDDGVRLNELRSSGGVPGNHVCTTASS